MTNKGNVVVMENAKHCGTISLWDSNAIGDKNTISLNTHLE